MTRRIASNAYMRPADVAGQENMCLLIGRRYGFSRAVRRGPFLVVSIGFLLDTAPVIY
jgi:hypothetical protein